MNVGKDSAFCFDLQTPIKLEVEGNNIVEQLAAALSETARRRSENERLRKLTAHTRRYATVVHKWFSHGKWTLKGPLLPLFRPTKKRALDPTTREVPAPLWRGL
jgi:hypothetical protein